MLTLGPRGLQGRDWGGWIVRLTFPGEEDVPLPGLVAGPDARSCVQAAFFSGRWTRSKVQLKPARVPVHITNARILKVECRTAPGM